MSFFKKLFLTTFFFLFLNGVQAGQKVPILTYHIHPPFVVGEGKGLSYDLAKLVTKKSKGKYNFEIRELPRVRLNQEIKSKKPWVSVWANPLWFGDKNKKKFFWLELLKDANSIISRNNLKINYDNPNSLLGKKFGGIRGHKYVGLDDLLKAKKIKGTKTDNERDLLRMLLHNRVDVILLPKSTISFYIKTLNLKKKVFVGKTPHQSYMRHIMVPRGQEKLHSFLEKLNLEEDNDWKGLLKKYGF
jgi:polar amino acid transport system substrate-binding protein